jgi:hypothetical protein
VNERRGSAGYLVAAATAPWLMRWVLLQDDYERAWPPGPDPKTYIHVVCPQRGNGCDSQDWVEKYERGTVTKCSRHRPQLPRQRMVPCPECEEHPGSHENPRAAG